MVARDAVQTLFVEQGAQKEHQLVIRLASATLHPLAFPSTRDSFSSCPCEPDLALPRRKYLTTTPLKSPVTAAPDTAPG